MANIFYLVAHGSDNGNGSNNGHVPFVITQAGAQDLVQSGKAKCYRSRLVPTTYYIRFHDRNDFKRIDDIFDAYNTIGH
jgi:hypothetical protein